MDSLTLAPTIGSYVNCYSSDEGEELEGQRVVVGGHVVNTIQRGYGQAPLVILRDLAGALALGRHAPPGHPRRRRRLDLGMRPKRWDRTGSGKPWIAHPKRHAQPESASGGGHNPLPSFLSNYPWVTPADLGPGKAPGGYETCMDCEACESQEPEAA